MSFADSVERTLLFRLVRILAFFFIIIAFLAILGAVIMTTVKMIPSSIDVSKEEISAIVPLPAKDMRGADKAFQETVSKSHLEVKKNNTRLLPFAVQKEFSHPETQAFLEKWLNGFAKADQEKALKELESVILLAGERNVDVSDAIEKFTDLKSEKVNKADSEKQASILGNTMALYLIGISIVIIALFSLVLVLLAIERNTRKV